MSRPSRCLSYELVEDHAVQSTEPAQAKQVLRAEDLKLQGTYSSWEGLRNTLNGLALDWASEETRSFA